MAKHNYPFVQGDCEHNKAFTDPEGIGVCKQCLAMNVALSETPLEMDEVEATYTLMAGIHGFFEETDDDE